MQSWRNLEDEKALEARFVRFKTGTPLRALAGPLAPALLSEPAALGQLRAQRR